MDANTKLIWLDMEMSGLEVKSSVILQIAIIITDANLNELHQGISYVIKQPPHILKNMDEWNTEQHQKSGLIEKCLEAQLELKEVEKFCIDYVEKYTVNKGSPLCGSTILQDRRFLYEYMSKFSEVVHYRSLDVSSFKILKEINFFKSNLCRNYR